MSLRARLLAIVLGVTALGAGVFVRVSLQSEPSAHTNASATRRTTTTSTSTTSTTVPPTTTTVPPTTIAPKPVAPKPVAPTTVVPLPRKPRAVGNTTYSSVAFFEGDQAEINRVVSGTTDMSS